MRRAERRAKRIELAVAFDGAVKRFSPFEEETPAAAAAAAAAVQIQFRANFVPRECGTSRGANQISFTRFVHT